MEINPLDIERLRSQFQSASPFPYVEIPSFLSDDFARELAASYPTFEQCQQLGFGFSAVNERKKVQITDPERFPAPVARLHALLASPEFLAQVEQITGIPRLLADEQLVGGGMHVTGPHGRLDVHIDFNYLEERKLHRRLNILVYLNPTWNRAWGGSLELWDREVKNCVRSFAPELNRCVLFETSNISYHGVQPLTCPPSLARQSFAAYYYTREAPKHWNGTVHSTNFRARPHEILRAKVLMPLESAERHVRGRVQAAKHKVKQLIGRV